MQLAGLGKKRQKAFTQWYTVCMKVNSVLGSAGILILPVKALLFFSWDSSKVHSFLMSEIMMATTIKKIIKKSISPELSLPRMAKPAGSCCCSHGSCWDKEAGGHMGQSSPCSSHPLGSLQPAIPTLPSVIGPHFWRDRSLSTPLGSFEAILVPTAMLFVMSKPTSNCTLVVPWHCPLPYLHIFPPSSHFMADLNQQTLVRLRTPSSSSYIFAHQFYWKQSNLKALWVKPDSYLSAPC